MKAESVKSKPIKIGELVSAFVLDLTTARRQKERGKKNEEKISWLRLLIFFAGRATISVVSSCKSDDADKLSSRFSMTQRGLPRKGAASSLPCAGALPPQSAEENLCRVRPLQHSEWRVLKGTQFGWNRGTREIFKRFIP